MSGLRYYRKTALLLVELSVLLLLAIPAPLQANTAPGYRYFDVSRAEWGANPAFDSRQELRAPASGQPFQVTSPELDTGKIFTPVIQPGQLISLPDLPQVPTGIAIHDTATPNTADCSVETSARLLRSIQSYHALSAYARISYGPDNPDPRHELDNRGLPDSTFGDLSYHFLIDCAGHIFEGRAGGIFKEGQHVHRHNRGLIAVALLGSFEDRQPPPAQRAALVRLLSRLCRDLTINPLGVWQQQLLNGSPETLSKNGRPVLNIAGHVDYPDNDHTDPGVLDLNALRQEVAAGLPGKNGLKFEETGQTLAEPFRSYWETNGGLPIFGFPVSPVLVEPGPEDGKTYQVQYFERARFELHPELVGTPYYISLGRLGLAAAGPSLKANPAFFAPFPPPPAGSLDYYFQATGHTIRGSFLKYWLEKGGLAIFGLPISEELQENNPQGQLLTVQYFERARFEFHPENPMPYWVLLSRLGADVYQAKVHQK
jgi:hypothetical protein